MGRIWRRKTETQGMTPPETMKVAVHEVICGKSIRRVADQYGIKRSTLQRYAQKQKALLNQGTGLSQEEVGMRFSPNYRNSRILDDSQEQLLADYLLRASKMNYGLAPKEAMKLAYEFANINNVKLPASWKLKQASGIEWFRLFMKRHPNLSVRTPEATSLSRATSFNKKNVNDFFENLHEVMTKFSFPPQNIYNVDESGLTTVQKPDRIIAEKGSKQVSQVTSGERGALVTICCGVNALGNSIPPFLIFPRVNFKDHMIIGAPPGTVGVANPSGWMTGENFCKYLLHFAKHSNSSTSNPVLVIFDNHESHITIEGISLAKEKGIVLVTLPPHCSHKLQPLDRTVFGPLKKYYNTSCDNWMLKNPGKPLSIYDISGLVGQAYPLSFTPTNIKSGFSVAGIWPFNRHVFSDDEFLSSYVTDREAPKEDSLSRPHIEQPALDNVTPCNSGSHLDGDTVTLETNLTPQQMSPTANDRIGLVVTPEEIRPFPKAGQRKSTGGRKKGKTLILTNTPVKKQIELEAHMRSGKSKYQKSMPKSKMCKEDTPKSIGKGKQIKKKKSKLIDEEDSEDEWFCLVCCDSYANSASKEKWIQCYECKYWAHQKCTDGTAYYLCHNCTSDDSD